MTRFLYLKKKLLATGYGANLKAAEFAAAEKALIELGINNDT